MTKISITVNFNLPTKEERDTYLEAARKKLLAHKGGEYLDVDGKLRLLAIDRDELFQSSINCAYKNQSLDSINKDHNDNVV